ncbi:MAG: HDIG domain-containing metalloprotein [Bacteroidota bacterium]
MTKTTGYRKKIYNRIYRTSIFLLSIALIIYMLPHEGKFRYEFSKGKPWHHETLIAQFDFPIYKTDEELAFQTDSIKENVKPYYRKNSSVYSEKLVAFNLSFDESWNSHVDKYYVIKEKRNHEKLLMKLAEEKAEYLKFFTEILDFIYTKGVIEFQQGSTIPLDDNDFTLVLVSDNIAEEITLSNIFTKKTAYEYARVQLAEHISSNYLSDEKAKDFLNSVNLFEFIASNYFYDEETALKIVKNSTQNLSLTHGMVQIGERIISEGDVVNNHRFRILQSLKKEYEENLTYSVNKYLIYLGQILLIFFAILSIYLFLLNFRKNVIHDNVKTAFIIVFIVLMVFVARIVINYNFLSLYLIPFAILPIIIRTFYDSRLALFIHMITILIIGFFAPNSFEFVFLQMIAGIMAIFSLKSILRRGQLFLSAFIIFSTYCFIYFGLAIIQEGDLYTIDYKNFAWFAGNGLLLLSAYPMIYIFEKIFGFLSDVTLMELSDTNHPILRELAEKAPGTFQHSLQVGNLAEESIRRIGGNPLLARTGALYHDIGKMDIPLFFIENQLHGINPHDKIEFDKSAEIIISHVKRGTDKAKKHNIPDQVVDFIRTHHGTSKVQYFYKSYLSLHPDEKVDEEKFTYPGTSPRSKEQAVVMMCDSVEAAARSLKTITDASIDELVEKIIAFQIDENQFKYADITFKDITTVKSILKKKLRNIYHTRIEYPE